MILQQPLAIPSLGFLPTKIAGCKLWLKAEAITGLNDGDPVATWPDSSGLGNDVTQGTAGNKPLYKTNIINSLPAVKFDGTDDFMSHASDLIVQPLTIFIVTQPTLNTASQKSYACLLHGKIQAGTGFFIVARLSTNFWGTFCAADLSSTNALTSGSNYLLENTATSNSTFLYQRGVQVATTTSGSEVSPTGSTSLVVGKDIINASREYAGYMADIIIYDTILSSGNRVLVENYLIARYAL